VPDSVCKLPRLLGHGQRLLVPVEMAQPDGLGRPGQLLRPRQGGCVSARRARAAWHGARPRSRKKPALGPA
jgi:hypothetical protein